MTQFSFLLLISLAVLGSEPVSAQIQTDGPLGTGRWTGGASWNPDGSIDDLPNSGPINGIIRCGSAAETQSQIGSTGNYDPSVFEVVMDNPVCVEPSSGNSVTISPPTSGEPVIWLNFDVRPYAGTFEIQINDNSGDVIAWALYASNSPTTGTTTSALTGEELSGDPEDLTFLTCGVESASTWNTLPVPDFPVATNCYLVVWDQDADGDVQINNFKARFGCGDSDAVLCVVDATDVQTACQGANYTVSVTIEGVNGEFTISDPNALTTPSPVSICLGNPANGGELSGTFEVTYASGVDYDLTIQSVTAPAECADPLNPTDCVLSVSGAGLVCEVTGCTDPCACNYDESANVGDPDSCVFDCHGCIYPSASNYDATALLDDGTCIFEGCMHYGCVPYNALANSQPLNACDNPVGFGDFNQDNLVNSSDFQDMLSAYTATNSDWNGITWIQNACGGETTDVTGEVTVPESDCFLSGCMYPEALNYNSAAIQDPGMCLFAGCTETSALNYNPHANVEDGSCRFTLCPDFNNNGTVELNDLMSILSVYGQYYGN